MNRFIVMAVAMGMLAAGGAARAADALAEDEAAIAKYIQALQNPGSEVREAAAKSLREIVAKYGNGTSNIREKDAGEARWMEKVNQIKPGMIAAQVLKLLPRFSESEQCENWSGGTGSVSYRLDPHWLVVVSYQYPDKVIERPTLIRKELGVGGPPPPGYTGVWSNWYINGQRASEVQYKDGKYNGTLTSYHDNGQKCYEQHYVNHVVDGPDAGWYPDGRKMYVGQYRNGKKDGKWIHWHAAGRKQHESNYKDDKFDGLDAGWYENGQMSFAYHYKDGVRDSEAGWNEQGVLQYKREYKDGKLVQ